MFKRSAGLRRARRATNKRNAAILPEVGMEVTFRAEVMPSRETIDRTFQVSRVLANGRVELANLQGQHAIAEFEPLQHGNGNEPGDFDERTAE